MILISAFGIVDVSSITGEPVIGFSTGGIVSYTAATPPVEPPTVSYGFYGISFRRKRKLPEEQDPSVPDSELVQQTVLRLLDGIENPEEPTFKRVKVEVSVQAVSELVEEVKIRVENVKRQDFDAILVAILVAELL